MAHKIHRYKRMLFKPLFSLAVGAGLMALVFNLADFSWEDIGIHIFQGRLSLLLGVLVCTAMIYYVSAFRWAYIIKDLSIDETKVPIGYLYHYISMGSMSSLVLPLVVGDVSIRILSLRMKNGVSLSRAAYSIIFDQLITFMTNTIYVLPALAFLLKTLSIGAAMALALMMVAFFFVIAWRLNRSIFSTVARLYAFIVHLTSGLPFVNRGRVDFQAQADNFSVSSGTVLKVLACGQIKYLLIIFRLNVVAVSLNLDIGFWTFFLGCSLVLTISLISFIPANLGVSELGWYGVLSLAGIPDQNVVTFIFCERIFSSLSIIIVGGMTWLICQVTGHALTSRESKPELL